MHVIQVTKLWRKQNLYKKLAQNNSKKKSTKMHLAWITRRNFTELILCLLDHVGETEKGVGSM